MQPWYPLSTSRLDATQMQKKINGGKVNTGKGDGPPPARTADLWQSGTPSGGTMLTSPNIVLLLAKQ